MPKPHHKRTVDMQVIADWIEPGSRVLDLGCGRGVLLEYLVQRKAVEAVGVDTSFSKVTSCIRRGLAAYQGDMEGFLREFPDGFFDHVLCSRTLQELAAPARVINEALRVGRRLAVGFVNHGYWENRVSLALNGRRLVNEVYPRSGRTVGQAIRFRWSSSNGFAGTIESKCCAGSICGVIGRRPVVFSGTCSAVTHSTK